MLWVSLLAFLSVLMFMQGMAVRIQQRAGGAALRAALLNLRSGTAVVDVPAPPWEKTASGAMSILERLLDRLRPYGARATPEDVEQRLLWAGLSMDAQRFGSIRLLCTCVGAAAGILLIGPLLGSLSSALLMGVVGAAAGWIGTDQWLTARIRRRHRDVEKELPTYVGLLATAMAADLTLEQALEQVRLEFPGILSTVFAAAGRARLAGQTLDEGLLWAADQLGHPDVTNVVQQIIKARQYGTPLSDELGHLATTLEHIERQRAEERARRLGVLLILPVAMFIMPATLLILGYPAMVTLLRNLLASS